MTADDVAAAIEAVLKKPKAEVWVPNWVQGPTKVTQALPRKVQDLLAKTNDAATVLAQADPVARAAYEERARRNAK